MREFIAVTVVLMLVLGFMSPLSASEDGIQGERVVIPLYEGKPYLHVMHNGRSIKVQRVQDREFELHGYFARTSRECPPFCLGPMEVDPAVKTIGEIEVFKFMENQLRDGTGLLIDARTADWYAKGTIPGSVNIPFTVLSLGPDDLEMEEVLLSFGAKPRESSGGLTRKLEQWGVMDAGPVTDQWDFTECKELVLWCNGPTCGQSPRAIRGLLAVGYPADKIRYYRGGMQLWQLFGLNTIN